MIQLENYKILREIHSTTNSLIVKAIRIKDQMPVIIKILNKEYPSNEEIKKFRFEFEISKKLHAVPGIVKCIELLNVSNSLAIVMEDIDGESLDKVLKIKKIDLDLFLKIVIELCRIIGEMHKKNIIHKDIKPSNIIVNLTNFNMQIIDFSISSELSRENQKSINPDHLEGTLAYISPEQTGRMNRMIDYRTDFYSLGITLYEMITGRVPFAANDPMELVHSHIAKLPQSPIEINDKTPLVLSKIIMKLLSKNAEERYQSINGLIGDLKRCEAMLKEKKEIKNFDIAQNDFSEKFQIPEKLYGREKEIKILLDAFEKTKNSKKETILFSGNPGIGKSSLINEMHKPLIEKHGYFISGKFDQLNRNIPFNAVVQAFQELAKQLAAEKENAVKKWKDEILKAVGSIGQVIIDVIPAFELVMGKQPEVQELPAAEALNRFNLVFQNFIKVFASKDHPLVIFLDDLQWADNASLLFLELLLNDPELGYFLLIGAYRDNEVDAAHPLTLMLEKLKKTGFEYDNIKLESLDEKSIQNLIADTLHSAPEKTEDLAKLVLAKTAGNPFFINAFLKKLYDEELIYFDKKWKYDIKKIKETKVTDNVVLLMAENIKKLPDNTLMTIKTASCIGNKFNLEVLSDVLGKNENETLLDLSFAVNEGMVIKNNIDVSFVHDRVREAAYSLLDDNEKTKLHYSIGKKLLAKHKGNELEENIFDILNQLNFSISILDEDEKKQIIELNLKAGKKAKASAAFDAALIFFKKGMELLTEDGWKTEYNITVNITTERGEAEYLNGNFDESEKYLNMVLNNGKTIFDKIRIYEIKIAIYTSRNNFNEVIKIGLKALKELNIKLPSNPSQISVIQYLLKYKFITRNIKIEELIELPELKDKNKLAALRLLFVLLPATFLSSPNLLPIITIQILILTFKYGLNPYSAFCYVSYGMINILFNDYKSGFAYGKLALKIIEKFDNKEIKGQVLYVYAFLINFWFKHVKENLYYFLEGFKICLETGNFPYSSFSINQYLTAEIYMGKNLDLIEEDFNKYRNFMIKTKLIMEYQYFNLYYSLVINLKKINKNKFVFNNEYFNEEKMLIEWEKDRNINLLFCYNLLKSMIYYLFDEYEKSYEFNSKSIKYISNAGTIIDIFGQNFYSSLSLTGLLSLGNNSKKNKKYLRKINSNQKRMKIWAENCKENFLHPYLLIKAELARILNDRETAMRLYDEAIASAHDNEFTNIEAIANECAAKYYLSKGINKLFQIYMTEACYCYLKWGAIAKVNQLKEKYPELFQAMSKLDSKKIDIMKNTLSTISDTNSFASSLTGTSLDIASIMKSTMAISGEIKIHELFKKLTKIVIENAGAQKGVIIINKNNELFIESESEIDNKDLIILKSEPISKTSKLPEAIINYVFRTKEIVKLDNAFKEGNFINDSYIRKNLSKSVLCMPIIHQNNSIGILYLENNISTHAFKNEHIEVLKILSSQAAISINNIYLFEKSKEKELMDKELLLASDIQKSMFPKKLPEIKGFDLYAFCIMSNKAGGDFYDVIPITSDNYLIIIGDVSGKGISSALYMSSIINMIRVLIESDKDKINRISNKTFLKVMIEQLNKVLKNVMRKDSFVTLFFGLLNIKTNSFLYTSCGHEPVYLFNPSTANFSTLKTKGMAAGALSSEIFNKNIEEKEITINKNDFIIFNTDGITEARDKNNNDYYEKFLESIRTIKENDSSISCAKKILKDYSDFVQDQLQFDDLTLICLKKNDS